MQLPCLKYFMFKLYLLYHFLRQNTAVIGMHVGVHFTVSLPSYFFSGLLFTTLSLEYCLLLKLEKIPFAFSFSNPQSLTRS